MAISPPTIPTLFTPLKVGAITLGHRIAMAPLTRFRANAEHEHTDLGVEYYEQRCDSKGTLIITEATFISPAAGGYPNVPGCYTDAQVAAWKKIVSAVHAKGSLIYLQLWALGRAAPATYKDAPFDVVSSADIAFEGGAKPRGLSQEELTVYVKEYAECARRFVEEAGGDGVEIHGANGYLIDQFLQTTSNARTDKYGGSIENRCRFGLEVVDAVVAAVGAEKTGIRLSPYSTFQGMKMSSTSEIHSTFTHFVSSLVSSHPNLAYIHVVEGRIKGNDDVSASEEETIDFLYDLWTPRPFFVAGGFKAQSSLDEAERRRNTVVVLGRLFISNPDVVKRIKHGVALTDYDRSTFYVYGHHPEGYTDYPVAKELVGLE